MLQYNCTFLLICLVLIIDVTGGADPARSYAKLPLKSPSLRFLEGNSLQLHIANTHILVDPVMSQLDFNIPWLYRGNKRVLNGENELRDALPYTDVVLITQGFDDHAHRPTLERIRQLTPSMQFLCPPSAVSILQQCRISESNIRILKHGDNFVYVNPRNNCKIDVVVTQGALLGPPWQTKENGYIFKPHSSTGNAEESFPSIYLEPHGVFDRIELSKYTADVVVSPIVSQQIGSYKLVSGSEESADLCSVLKAKVLFPLCNGELKQVGLLANIIRSEGNVPVFKNMLQRRGLSTQVRESEPGEWVDLSI